ncbi:uncharacterized protein BN629_01230 [Eggerthella sp. CAG:368]|nr:uncharacterized protein BN629_01230 [Eggerthella sp. CAG:368]
MADLEPIDNNLTTVGQPTSGGCVYVAFKANPTLPSDATTKMDTLADFVSLGDISENGFTEANARSKNKHKNWNGDVVRTSISDEENTYKLEFIEPNRPSVAKLRYGSGNVEAGTDGSVSHIKGVLGTDEQVALVIDELESGGFLRRTVIPCATIDSFDDVAHQKGSLLVYGMTFTAVKGTGNIFDIYRAKPATA